MKTFIAAATLALSSSAGASTISIQGDTYTVTMEGDRPTFRRPGPDMFEGGKGMTGEVRVTPRARPCAPLPMCSIEATDLLKIVTTHWSETEMTTDRSLITTSGQTVEPLFTTSTTGDWGSDMSTTFLTERGQDHTHEYHITQRHDDYTPSPVPLPASLGMLGAAMAGLFGLRRRKGKTT